MGNTNETTSIPSLTVVSSTSSLRLGSSEAEEPSRETTCVVDSPVFLSSSSCFDVTASVLVVEDSSVASLSP